ncbi:MAG: hypothetical protein H6882_05215 [Rhodobiaceae bacterium]|nr:hypothetical protein [Rhodobiaceae bacterium]
MSPIILTCERDAARIAHDVRDMRERVYREKGSADVWNLKAVRGGLTDVEFIVQYLMLVHAHDRPAILTGSTVSALTALRDAGFLDAGAAETLAEAAGLYGRILQILRAATDGAFDPQTAPRGLAAMLAAVAGEPSFDRLAPRLERLQGEVDALLRELVPAADGEEQAARTE